MYRQIIYALTTMFFCFYIWLKYIDFYTDHNQYIKLPNFYGIHINNLDSVCERLGLRYIIIDSAFNKKVEKGIVLEQDPMSGVDVKKNRRIYFTINALQNRIINFPNIKDQSLRQAVRELENIGLVVGELEYKYDLAKNVVLDHKVNGIKIEAGQELFVGTNIDLLIGSGLSNETTSIPNLLDLTLKNAQTEIKIASLNLGAIMFDEGVIDSISAKVYKQNPVVNEKRKVKLGTSIDIYLK